MKHQRSTNEAPIKQQASDTCENKQKASRAVKSSNKSREEGRIEDDASGYNEIMRVSVA